MNEEDTPVEESIYDHPLYYDILFGWDRDGEAGFYSSAFRHYGVPIGARLLELGCGTGQVAIRLARLGWRATGLDISADMLTFLDRAARDAGVAVHTVCGDMASFSASDRFDGAYCPLSTFRMLKDDALATAHLSAVAQALAPNGVYILDLAFVEDDRSPEAAGAGSDSSGDVWAMQRGKIEVKAEGEYVSVHDGIGGTHTILNWGPQGGLREYTCEDFCGIVDRTGQWDIVGWHPERGRGADGVSIFEVEHTTRPPLSGRAMVVLRRSAS